jgi:hypothetical protein
MKHRIFLNPAQFRHAPFATVLGIAVQALMWGSFVMAHVAVVLAMSNPRAILWSPACLALTALAFVLWNYCVRPLARAEIRRYFKKQEIKNSKTEN